MDSIVYSQSNQELKKKTGTVALVFNPAENLIGEISSCAFGIAYNCTVGSQTETKGCA